MDMEKLRKINELANTLRQKGITTSRSEAAHIAGSLAGTSAEQEFSNDISFRMNEAAAPSRESLQQNKQHTVSESPMQRSSSDTKTYVDEKRLINILQEFTGVFEKKNEDMANELKGIINRQQERINELTNALQSLSKSHDEIRSNAVSSQRMVQSSQVQSQHHSSSAEDSLVSELIGEVPQVRAGAPQVVQQNIPGSTNQQYLDQISQQQQGSNHHAKPEERKSTSPRSGGYSSTDVDVLKVFYCGGKK